MGIATVPDSHRFRLEALAGMQLAPGVGRAASISHVSFSIAAISKPIRCSKAPRETSTIWADLMPVFDVVESPAASTSGAPQCR